MGRPPKSDADKELSGAFAKNPSRRKKKDSPPPPSATDLGPPPARFLTQFSDREHLEAWREIISIAESCGIHLVAAQRFAVESLARATVIMRHSKKTSDCKNVIAIQKELGIGIIPTKREVEKAVEKPEPDEWSHLTTPPAPPATRVQ